MRIRTIKPEFFTHEGLYEIEAETKLPIRVAFAGLWCIADREGRFKWEPRRIGIHILPYDNVDFSRVLDALGTRAFIVKYRVGHAWYGCIPSFKTHQIVNNRESQSKIPDISEAIETEYLDASSTREARVGHASCGEGKGKEGKGTYSLESVNAHDSKFNSCERPNLKEVLFYADKIGLAKWKAEDWFNEMEGCGWLDHLKRPIVVWNKVLDRVRTKWESDGRPSGPPAAKMNGQQKQGGHSGKYDSHEYIEPKIINIH